MQKICTKCNINKKISDYYKLKNCSLGIMSECKECVKIRRNLFYNDNKEKVSQGMKLYYQRNSKKIRLKVAKFRKTRQFKSWQYKYRKQIVPRLLCSIRGRIRLALKRILSHKVYKSDNTMKLLGCSIEQLKIHLESKFTDGMNWENYGVGYKIDKRGMPIYDKNGNTILLQQWQIDHIKPCAAFDLTQESEQRKCFHYSNLQPLWAQDNLMKSDRENIIYPL